MTTSQRPQRPGSPVWRALGSSVRALRNARAEQAYAWERFIRSCRAPQPCTHVPGRAAGGHPAGPAGRSPAMAGPGSSDRRLAVTGRRAR
jgi:hypothetical protein